MRIQKYGACFALFSPTSFNFGAFDAYMAVVMEKKKRGEEERQRRRVRLVGEREKEGQTS